MPAKDQKLVKIFLSMKRTFPEPVSHVLLQRVHRQNMRAASRNRGVANPGHFWTRALSRRSVFPAAPARRLAEAVLTVISDQKAWLGRTMGSDFPLLPVHTVDELNLYYTIQNRLRAENEARLMQHMRDSGGDSPIDPVSASSPTVSQLTVAFNRYVTIVFFNAAREQLSSQLTEDGLAQRAGRRAKKVEVLRPVVYQKTLEQLGAYESRAARIRNVRSTLLQRELSQQTLSAGQTYVAFGEDPADIVHVIRPRRAAAPHTGGAVAASAANAGGGAGTPDASAGRPSERSLGPGSAERAGGDEGARPDVDLGEATKKKTIALARKGRDVVSRILARVLRPLWLLRVLPLKVALEQQQILVPAQARQWPLLEALPAGPLWLPHPGTAHCMVFRAAPCAHRRYRSCLLARRRLHFRHIFIQDRWLLSLVIIYTCLYI